MGRPTLGLNDGFDDTSPNLRDAVKELQTELNKEGFALQVDGLFGAGTEQAVIKFQSSHGLTADGIVGPRTWEALLGASDPLDNPTPTNIFGFTVRQMPMGAGIHAPIAHPVVGVLHTTEGSTAAGAAATFHKNGDPPHFAVDSGSIIQFRSLSQRAMSLVHAPGRNATFKGATNAFAIQIEIAGFSKTDLWLPDENTVARVAAVMAYASRFHNIPLVVPNPDWPDDCSDLPRPAPQKWATRNSRRIFAETHWPDTRGWWMHLEVPGQATSFHWDCGAIRRTVLLQRASAILDALQ